MLLSEFRLHHVIQELRGNVRVFARVRPFLPCDGATDEAIPSIIPKSETSLKLVSILYNDNEFPNQIISASSN